MKEAKGIQKYLGLMFSRKPNECIIFDTGKEQRLLIHTLFVFFPICIWFLNNKKEIVEQKTMKPFNFYVSKEKSRYFVERAI